MSDRHLLIIEGIIAEKKGVVFLAAVNDADECECNQDGE